MASQVSAGLTVAFRDGKGVGFEFDDGLVIGLSILIGTMVAFFPVDVLNIIPPFLRPIVGNGFVAGVVSAIVLEHVILKKNK
jgi:xanthine/uracil permease